MKIWYGFGTEHSMNLVMIGTFATEDDAVEIEELFSRIGQQINGDVMEGYMTVGEHRESISDGLREIIRDREYTLMIAPDEYEDFAYEHDVERNGNQLILRTAEVDVTGFLKLMLAGHAKVEVFSAHHHADPND